MSFILDALKKLEREKETRESGVVMVGPVQWGGPERARSGRRLAVSAAALVALVTAATWWLSSRPVAAPTVPETSADASPAEPPAAPASMQPAPIAARSGRDVRAGHDEPALAERPRTVTAPSPRGLDLPGDRSEEIGAAPEASIIEDPPVRTEEAPLATLVPVASPPPKFRLTAISERDGEPIALLNDRLVREGDSFDGLRILSIGEPEIEIEVDGQRQTIGF